MSTIGSRAIASQVNHAIALIRRDPSVIFIFRQFPDLPASQLPVHLSESSEVLWWYVERETLANPTIELIGIIRVWKVTMQGSC